MSFIEANILGGHNVEQIVLILRMSLTPSTRLSLKLESGLPLIVPYTIKINKSKNQSLSRAFF